MLTLCSCWIEFNKHTHCNFEFTLFWRFSCYFLGWNLVPCFFSMSEIHPLFRFGGARINSWYVSSNFLCNTLCVSHNTVHTLHVFLYFNQVICFVFHIVQMDTVHSAAGFHVSPTGRGSSGFKITTAEPNLLRREPKPKFNPFHWEQMNPQPTFLGARYFNWSLVFALKLFCWNEIRAPQNVV